MSAASPRSASPSPGSICSSSAASCSSSRISGRTGRADAWPKLSVSHANGGPEVLRPMRTSIRRQPGAGEVLIRHTAIGLNFIDIYYRTGLYPPPGGLPLIPGSEAAGVVMESARASTGSSPATASPMPATSAPMPKSAYRRRPSGEGAGRHQRRAGRGDDAEGHDRRISAAPHLQGEGGRHDPVPCRRRRRRADPRPMGQASRRDRHRHGQLAPTRSKLAKAHGFDHVINYHDRISSPAVRAITGGKMCDVVYDSVGKDTFPASLDCLRPLGMFVSFGQSSGPIPPFKMSLLSQKGSLLCHAADAVRLQRQARRSRSLRRRAVRRGARAAPSRSRSTSAIALKDAGKAHADLEGRRTTGTTILIP